MLPGLFVRDTVRRTTLMRLQLFGVLKATSKDEYFRFGEMVYDGDGVFRIRFTGQGRRKRTSSAGASRSRLRLPRRRSRL